MAGQAASTGFAGQSRRKPTFARCDRSFSLVTFSAVLGYFAAAHSAELDPAAVQIKTPDQFKAGSFVTELGKQVHWAGAKDEDAVVLVFGEGPTTSTAVEEAK